MSMSLPDLDHLDRVIEDGEQRIDAQERLIKRLRADGHDGGVIDKAERILREMVELRTLQLKLREQAKQLAEYRSPKL